MSVGRHRRFSNWKSEGVVMKRLILTIVAVGLVAGSVLAQVTTGGMEGRIFDADGNPIPDVEVIVSSPSLQGTRGVLTDPEGRFRMIGLPVGTYRVEFSHVAYRNAAIEEIFWGGILAEQNLWPTVRDLLFGGYHGLVMALFVSGLWVGVSVILLAAAAWVWRTMARLSRGLCVSWLTHVVADVGIMAAIYLLVN